MRGAHLSTILRRELAAYFNSAIAYIFIIIFILLNGGLYLTQFFLIGRADMRPFFMTLPFLLAIFLPAVTMRLWAEEKKGNTLELLLTFPMSTQELVLGKFIASFIFYLAALFSTLSIPVMIAILGRPDFGAIAGGYLGAAFLGALFLAAGIFVSGLCRDQIVAFIVAMMTCFSLYLMGTELVAASVDGWLPGLGSLLRRFVGAAPHFDSFAKGVVDIRDTAYFVIGIIIFLILNAFWLEGRMRPKARAIFSTAASISAAIFLMANWFLGGLALGRFDLTEGKIYTVSEAGKKILRELEVPVTAKLYISPSEKMPTGMKTLEQDVIDKLDEFRLASKGKFQYKIFHMEAAPMDAGEPPEGGGESLERQLSRKGIEPFQVQSIEADEVGVRLVYASLALAYKEKPEEIIPRLTPDTVDEMEYLVISKIYRMTLEQTPEIALMAPYEEKSVDPQLAALLSQLGAGQLPGNYREDPYEFLPMILEYEGYRVSRIRLSEEETIPENAKTLLVAEPQNLNDRQRYEINRFLRSGGSVFMAVQNYTYDYVPRGRRLQVIPQDKHPGINELLTHWGLEIDRDILLDLQHEVISISGAQTLGPFQMAVPVKLPLQIVIPPSGMNPGFSITSRLSSIFYLWGSAVKKDPEKIKAQNLNVTTLLSSSKDSWTIPLRPGALSPDDLIPNPKAKQGPFPVAVMAQGQFADAYEGKEIPSWPKPEPVEAPEGEGGGKLKENIAEVKKESSQITPAPGKLILIGAATPFQKQLFQAGGHMTFFLNSVDGLTLGDELVKIRSKQPIDRTIGRVSTAAKVFWRFFVTLFIPVAIAALGTFRVVLRKRAKANYLKALSQAA